MTANQWLAPLYTTMDTVGFLLFLIVFPVYHALYPWLAKVFSHQASKVRFDLFRESWIEGLVKRHDVIAAAQQTRNLTMVNTVLVSATLILIGLIANIIVQLPNINDHEIVPQDWVSHPDIVRVKLYILILIFAVAFSYFMTSLRHLGHFVLVIGADPDLIREHKGSPVKYFSALVNRASNRHTLGVRYLYSALAILGWLFDPWLFIAITLFFGLKFVLFQDFTRKVYQ